MATEHPHIYNTPSPYLRLPLSPSPPIYVYPTLLSLPSAPLTSRVEYRPPAIAGSHTTEGCALHILSTGGSIIGASSNEFCIFVLHIDEKYYTENLRRLINIWKNNPLIGNFSVAIYIDNSYYALEMSHCSPH